jgi:hypothetical protein
LAAFFYINTCKVNENRLSMAKKPVSKDPVKKAKSKDKIDFEPMIDDSPQLDVAVKEWVMDGDLSDIEQMQPLLDELAETLSIQGRLRKRVTMRRFRTRIKVARVRTLKRNANYAQLQRRARASAINGYKLRFFGGRNMAAYRKASPSQKAAIERLVSRRKNAINRSTTKLINTKRKLDWARHQQHNSVEYAGNHLIEQFNNIYNSLIKDKNNATIWKK